jgi:hypothetical protein
VRSAIEKTTGFLKAARIGMRGSLIKPSRRPAFDKCSTLQHGDLARHIERGGKVVGNEQRGEPDPLLQVLDKVEDLRLNGNVKRTHRLVEDDKPRGRDQSACDGNTLALSTRQFVRVAAFHSRRQPDRSEHLAHRRGHFAPRGRAADYQRLGNRSADAQAWIERPLRMLQDCGEAPAQLSAPRREWPPFK